MITCTITLDSRIVAAATAADEANARSAARLQVIEQDGESFAKYMFATRCQFHFFPEIMVETATQIAARFDLEFDDLLPDTDVIYPMNVDECVLEHLYERGAYIGKTDAGIEYCPSQLI